jgi:thymidylate synthase
LAHAHRNISFATAESFEAVLRDGTDVIVRGKPTKELRNRVTTILSPRERCVFLPGRNNNVFAQVAETMWVIGGRNDVAWLARYLPRAPEFSDDGGATWRGAYGPRLRSWAGDVDQIGEWRRLLLADTNSRRVVGVLFDPSRDFIDAKDIPCNNWLSWIIRDGKLHLNVAIRSNDAMWGFSGVNAFEWSVLHEMLAFWVGAEVGDVTYFATSYHLYEDYYPTAANVVQRFFSVTPYDHGIVPPAFRTPWDTFEETVHDWFAAEAELSADPSIVLQDRPATRDPFFASTLRLLRLKWGAEKWSEDELAAHMAALPEDDFAAAAYEFFGRKRAALRANAKQPGIAAFFRACEAAASNDASDLKQAIKALHARKNTGYADAWKKRGEVISILPNIARKVDRLQAFADHGQRLDGETLLDTAIDLFVYVAKYRLFLAEQTGADRSMLAAAPPEPISEQRENFDHLVDQAGFAAASDELAVQIARATAIFETLWPAASNASPIAERQAMAGALSSASKELIGRIVTEDRHTARAFIAYELSLLSKPSG